MVRLTPGTSITFIDDHPIIVSQERRALFEVNQIGGYIGCRLEDGVSLRQLAQEVEDRGFTPASAMLKDVLAEWSHSGLVYAMDSPPSAPPAAVQSISLAGMNFSLRYHDEVLASRVAPVFAHLEAPGAAPGICYDLWSAHGFCLLSREPGRASMLQPDHAAPILKARMIQDFIGDGRQGLALHAGCLQRNERALLLTGRPGAGKTTLIAWLAGAGFAYHGDDITMLRPDGKVTGLPFLPTIKSGGWGLKTSSRGRQFQPHTHVRPDRKRVRYLVVPLPDEHGPLDVGWIVKLRRRKGAPARLVPQHPTALIKHLLADAASATGEVDRPTLDRLIRSVTAAGTYELHYENLNEATSLLERLCNDGPA